MSEGKATRVRAAKSGMRSPPAWYDGAAGFHDPIPGLPDFVSVAWIDEWTQAVPSHLRRLCDHVGGRKGTPFAWWPSERPSADEFAYLVALALREPRDVAILTRDYVSFERQSDKPLTFFRKLFDAPAEGNAAARLFASIVGDPVIARKQLLGFSSGLPTSLAADPSTPSVLAWARAEFSEHAPLVDAIPGPGVPDVPVPSAAAVAEPGPSGSGGDPSAAAAGPPTGDPDLDEAAAGFRAALGAVRDVAARCLATGAVGRSGVAPLAVAVREALRLARRQDALLAMPVSILPLLAEVRALIDRVEPIAPGRMPAWESAPEPVGRPESSEIASRTALLAELVARIESSFEEANAAGARLLAGGRLDSALVGEISRIHARAEGEVDGLAAEVEGLAGRIRSAQAEAALASVRAPAPAARSGEGPLPCPGPVAAPAAPGTATKHSCSVILHIGEDGLAHGEAVRTCLDWMRGKLPAARRGEIGEGGEFSLSTPDGVHARGAVAPTAPYRLWAGSFVEPDARVEGRSWRTDLCIGENEIGVVHVGVRVGILGPVGWRAADRRALPRLVRDIVDAGRAEDARRWLQASALGLSGDEGAVAFADLLFSEHRRLPVVAVSSRGGVSQDTVEATAKALAGAAHVVSIDPAAARAVAASVGGRWSVADGGVRILPPGLDRDADCPGEVTLHPGEATRLDRGRQGVGSHFVRVVSERVLGPTDTLFAREGLQDIDGVFDLAIGAIRTEADAAGEAAGLVPAEFVERHREEVERLRREREEGVRLMASFEEDMRAVESENIDAWGRNAALARENERLRRLLLAADVPMPEPEPRTVEEVCAFAETGLGSGVFVLDRAIRETGRAGNVQVRRLYEGLVFLRDWYLPHRRGEVGRPAYEAALAESRFEEAPCLSDLAALQVFHGYTAMWKGRRIELDRHLKWGRSANALVRIYFHYDEAAQELVIGSMPNHLENFMTN